MFKQIKTSRTKNYNMNKISVLTFLPDLARLCYCNQFLIKLMFAPASHQPVQECPHTTIIRLWNSLDNFPRIQCLLAAEHNLYNSCYYLARYHITSHHITSHHITSHHIHCMSLLGLILGKMFRF